MLEVALKYAEALEWAVLPLHNIEDGKCSCKNIKCTSPGKHPRTMKGVKDASKDVTQIQKWWGMWPTANIGIATGFISGFFAVDIDPRNFGDNQIEELQTAYGQTLPDDVYAFTGGSGTHILYKYPEQGLRSTKIKEQTTGNSGIDIKSDGGYILVEPSNHISGGTYEWELSSTPFENDLVPCPDWFLKVIGSPKPSIASRTSTSQEVSLLPPKEYQEIRSGLTSIPSDDREVWTTIGMALHSTRAMEQAYGLFNEWSQQSAKYDPADTRRVWESFTSYKGITLSTLFGMAKSTSLVVQAKAYLEDRKGQWSIIAADIGVSPQWISKFMAGAFDNPGVRTIEAVIEHKKKREAKLVKK